MNRMNSYTTEARASRIVGGAPFVFIVDDDVSVQESIELLAEECGWRHEAFASASQFLARDPPACPSCAIVDVGLPDLDGIELQRRISGSCPEIPIIFVTGCSDITTTVQAMKAGAIEFLTKPFSPQALRDAIRGAVDRSRVLLEQKAVQDAIRGRYHSLSPRERQVMGLVVQGRLNKQVAGTLGISEITVKAHRGRVMRKMGAMSLPELVTAAICLGFEFGRQWPSLNFL